jgi:hypothetical protein
MPSFHGWVPTAVGLLSYSIAGLSSYPSRVVFKGDLEDAGNNFIGFQSRNLSDTSIPFVAERLYLKRLFDKWIYGKSGDFVFVCVMRHWREDDTLKGKVFCIQRKHWRERARAEVRLIMDTLTSDPPDYHLGQIVFDRIESDVTFSARFTVKRNGTCTIDLEKMPADVSAFGDPEQTFASQVYFFVRDLLHTHKFHSPSTDKIIDVHREDWKKAVNYALARKAIRLRRTGRPFDLYNALGIISYLTAFREKVMTEEEKKEVPLSLETFADSIKNYAPLALILESGKLTNRLKAWIGRITLALSALIGLVVSIGKPDPTKQPELIRGLFGAIYDNYLSMLGVILVGCIFTQLVLAENVRPRDRIARNLSRYSVTFRQRKFGGVELLLGTLAICASGLIFATIWGSVVAP